MEQSCENSKISAKGEASSWKPLLKQVRGIVLLCSLIRTSDSLMVRTAEFPDGANLILKTGVHSLQMFVCSGVTVNFFISGLFFGAPTVLVPQIRKQANFTEAVGMETISWLFSLNIYGSIPWTLICPIVAERYGRKLPYILLWINNIVCAALFYFSKSFIELFISAFLQGFCPAIQITVGVMVLTEYTSPKYRGMLITFKGATFFWGVWISNAIGTFYYWKNIGILLFICCIYNTSSLFWPESPVWLATKGRFEECAKCHRWLKGVDKDSEEELQQLIYTQKNNLRRKQERQLSKSRNWVNKFYTYIIAKRFYKPLIYSVLITCLHQFTGKLACTGYIIHILKAITLSESTAYQGMLVLDGITVLGMYIGVYLNKFLKRRQLLLGSASIGAMFLFCLSTYLYLIHFNVIKENKYLTLFLLMGFSITISCGPMIMCMCLASELTPLKCRSLFLCIYGLLHNIIMGTMLKMFPFIFKYFKAHGTFLFFAIMSSIFIFILYKVLPETKNKTILEIEKYFTVENNDQKEQVELMNLEKETDKNQFSSVRDSG